jgi:hypothetical protein
MVGECVLLFIVGALLTVMSSGGDVGGFSVNGVLGFSTWIPSIDRHLWAVRCGYVPGPRVAECGNRLAGLLAWLGGLYIEVAEPLPPVCVGAFVVVTSVDAVMLRMLVDDALYGVVSRCELERRILLVGETLHDVVLRDRTTS